MEGVHGSLPKCASKCLGRPLDLHIGLRSLVNILLQWFVSSRFLLNLRSVPNEGKAQRRAKRLEVGGEI